MTDGDVLGQYRRVLRRHVEDAVVLDVGPGADADAVDVAPDHGVHPDAGVLAQLHVPDHLGGGVHPGPRAQRRTYPLVGADHAVPSENGQFSRPGACPEPFVIQHPGGLAGGRASSSRLSNRGESVPPGPPERETIPPVTRSADTRLGVLLVVLVLGAQRAGRVVAAGVPAQGEPGQGVRPPALHRDGQGGRGPPGAPEGAALLLPSRRSRPRAGALPCRAVGERRLLPGHERGSLRLPARALASPEGPRLRLVPARDRPPGRRPDAGGRAVVRVPVLDERPRRSLPGDAGLLPPRAREGRARSWA